MINLFEKAIIENKLVNFAIGAGNYYIPDRDYGEHSIVQSWTNFILPLIFLKGEKYVSLAVSKMFEQVLKDQTLNEKIKNETLLYHLNTYFYFVNEQRIDGSLLNHINVDLSRTLNDYIRSLSDIEIKEIYLECINLIKQRGGLSGC